MPADLQYWVWRPWYTGGRRGVHVLAELPSDPELLRRLRYVKEVLHQLVHRA